MKLLISIVLLCLLAMPVQAGPLTGVTVVLDPGHGGDDDGTYRRLGKLRITEAQLTWGVADELRRLLEADGAMVKLTARQVDLGPTFPTTAILGQDTIPARGTDYFVVDGQPAVNGERSGLEYRLLAARQALEQDFDATVIFLSIHFDHVFGDGCPAGTRVIYPAGAYDTLLVNCLLGSFADVGLVRHASQQPAVANGRSGLGRHLLVLRQYADARRIREKRRTRLVYNSVVSAVMLELANLPNQNDWQRLQEPGALGRYAWTIEQGLLGYQRQRLNVPREQ